ncbi:hypothetical protein [Nocardia mangyaensis]|uniref:hypothetical protein n=1 Tax=Nocardia mangyaensis TaxID=2213200 RepID=UPI0012EB88A6|nr:hypothetical protein [Nocardia mangyaensis]
MAVAVSTFLLPSNVASAGVLDLTCVPPSSETVTYNPALTSTPQATTVDVATVLGPCTSTSRPDITSGSRNVTVQLTRSCLELLDSGPTNFTLTWNTGETSTISANRASNIAGAVITVTHTGVVTSGVFTGDTVLLQTVGAATDILTCTLGLGTVANLYSTVLLEITSL